MSEEDNNGAQHSKNVAHNNPYAVKKVAPDLFQRPLEEFDNFEYEPMDQKQKLQTSDSAKKSATTAATGNEEENETTEIDNAAHSTAIAPGETKLTKEAVVTAGPMSIQLPMWKRLPSNTISFSSSEILTISEVCQFGLLYANQSIRMTGVLSHRICHAETGEVSLVLEDPLSKLSDSKNFSTAKKLSTQSRRISFGTTNQTNTTSKATTAGKRRSSLGMARNRTTPLISRGTATLASSSRSTVKTPLVSKLAPTTPRTGLMPNSNSNKFRTPALSSRKRGLSSVTKTPKSVQETMASALVAGRDKSAWIVADSRHVPVDTLAVGDLVTVMGTIHVYTTKDDSRIGDGSSEESSAQTSTSAAIRLVGGLILEQQQTFTNKQKMPKANDNNPSKENHTINNSGKTLFLQARVVRQDNGANLRLHVEALKLRRKHILSIYYPTAMQDDATTRREREDGQTREESTILLGCGPPPYNVSAAKSVQHE